MNSEKEYLKGLLQELPREKAPEGLTELIMQKIQAKPIVYLPTKSLKVWKAQAFYIMLGIIALEGWLLFSAKKWFTLMNVETLLKDAYIRSCQYLAANNFNTVFMGIALLGISLYLFVKYRQESTKTNLIMG